MTEGKPIPVDIDELFRDGTAIDEALRQSAQDARRRHKALGLPIAEWRDGKVVWVQPEDIVVYDSNGDPETNPPKP